MSNKKLNPQAPSFVPKKLSGLTSATASFEEAKGHIQYVDPLKTSPTQSGVPPLVHDPENEVLSEYLESCMKTADLLAGPDTRNLVPFLLS